MHNSQYIKIFYYTLLNCIGFGIVIGLIGLLDWPLLAEIPLAVSIFIEIIALGRSFFNSILDQREYNFSKLVSDIKIQLKHLKKAEKEIG